MKVPFDISPALLQGIALGLGAAAPIGPVNVQIARRALRDGFIAGFVLGCGAVSADVIYVIVSSMSLARFLDRPAVVRLVGAAGVVLLTYLALACFRAALRDWNIDPIAANVPLPGAAPAGRSGGGSARSGYVTGLLMTLLNPMTLTFWFMVVPALGAAGATGTGPGGAQTRQIAQESREQLPIICGGVFIGTLSWVIAFAGALGWAGRYRRNWWMAAADAAGGVTLLAFAAEALLRLISPFL